MGALSRAHRLTDVVALDDFLYGEPQKFGACCRGATCALTGSVAGCAAGGTYLGDASVCSPIIRGGTINACCPADFNGIGGQTVQDIFDFLGAWFNGC